MIRSNKIVGIATLVWALMACLDAMSQPIIREFIRISDRLLPSLGIEQRQDLVDFYQANRKPNTKSALGESVEITLITDSAMTVRLSPQSTLQALLLPKDSTYINLLIFSYADQFTQSRMVCYNRKGEPIALSTILPIISITDFVKANTPQDSLEALKAEIGLYFLTYSFDNQTKQLSATLAIQPNLTVSSPPSILNFIESNTRKYRWDGTKFEPSNSQSE